MIRPDRLRALLERDDVAAVVETPADLSGLRVPADPEHWHYTLLNWFAGERDWIVYFTH